MPAPPKTLLAIEDVPANLALLRAILEPAGYVVCDAPTLAAGRNAIEQAPPALVLLDVRLPDGNGLDLVREMRMRPDQATIPVLAVSASVLPADKAEAFTAGCSAFLAKPLRAAKLLETVRALLAPPTPPSLPSP